MLLELNTAAEWGRHAKVWVLNVTSTSLIQAASMILPPRYHSQFAKMANLTAKPFPFLELPPEIREKIHILICHQPAPIPLQGTPQTTSFPHALLQTCSRIYNELRPVYFTHNTFLISIRRRNDDLAYFLSPTFQDNRRQIRHLKIIIQRFGRHDYFTREFAPILEDLIMSGRLRELEIFVKQVFIMAVKMGGAEGFKDWVALRAIMLDPYLERRVLKSGHLNSIGPEPWDGIDDRDTTQLKDITSMLGEPGAEQNKAYGERMRAD